MIPIDDLQFGWFSVFVLLLIGYSILDGFDLGVGMLHLFASKDSERRLMLNSIGPVWDGNEVWFFYSRRSSFCRLSRYLCDHAFCFLHSCDAPFGRPYFPCRCD